MAQLAENDLPFVSLSPPTSSPDFDIDYQQFPDIDPYYGYYSSFNDDIFLTSDLLDLALQQLLGMSDSPQSTDAGASSSPSTTQTGYFSPEVYHHGTGSFIDIDPSAMHGTSPYTSGEREQVGPSNTPTTTGYPSTLTKTDLKPGKKSKVLTESRKKSSRDPATCTSPKDDKPHVCKFEGCRKRYARPSGLRQHLNTHTGDRPFQCIVEGCTKSFPYASNMARHARNVHGDKGCTALEQFREVSKWTESRGSKFVYESQMFDDSSDSDWDDTTSESSVSSDSSWELPF